MAGSSASDKRVKAQLQFNTPEVDDASRNSKDGQGQTLPSDTLLCKLFESQTGDWEMVGSDGIAYKFHQLVLNEQVARFRAIFAHPGTKEHLTKQIIVPAELEMTGPAVEAFLRYAYYQDTAPMKSSFGITCALIRAGHYYDVPKMVEDAYEALVYHKGVVRTKLEWEIFEESWKLYQQIWLWEEDHPSKKKLMENLASVLKEFSKGNVTSRSVPIESGPLVNLIRTFTQDQPPRLRAPPQQSRNPTTAVSNVFRLRCTDVREYDLRNQVSISVPQRLLDFTRILDPSNSQNN